MATLANYQYAYSLSGSSGSYTINAEAGDGGTVDAYTISDDTTSDGTADISATPSSVISVADSTDTSTLPDGVRSGATIAGYSSSNNDVYVTDGSTTYLLTNTIHSTFGASVADPNVTSGLYTYCFLVGTRITTPTGSIAVEDLKVGDVISTLDDNVSTVRFNFSQLKQGHIFAGKTHFPIKISAGALADNVPNVDLYVTPDHAIYFTELSIFAEASTLINGVSIYQLQEMPDSFIYHHILCHNQEIIFAANTPTETFIDNVTMQEFDNYADYLAMYSKAYEMIELDIPRAKSFRQLPLELKQQLAARTELLFPTRLTA